MQPSATQGTTQSQVVYSLAQQQQRNIQAAVQKQIQQQQQQQQQTKVNISTFCITKNNSQGGLYR